LRRRDRRRAPLSRPHRGSGRPAHPLWHRNARTRTNFNVTNGETRKPGERIVPNIEQMTYADRLNSQRSNFPVAKWRTAGERGWELYSKANCDRAESILHELIDGLIDVCEAAPEAKKVALFKTAVEALNELNDETEMIETGEREDLCELLDQIATDCGI